MKERTSIMDEKIRKYLLERKEYLEKLIKRKESDVKKAPEGFLRISRGVNKDQYFWRTDPKDKNGKYIPRKKDELAALLAQKDYDIKVISSAKKELKIVEKYNEYMENNGIDFIYKKLNSPRKKLVKPIELPIEEFVENWKKREYEPKGFDKTEAEFYSNKGVRVRSKSELMIANMLEYLNIPYIYEYPYYLKGLGTVHADFTCLNVRTRTVYVWEHFGMMDSIAYANKNTYKINVYGQNGFFAGINMIMTFETSQIPANSNIIKAIIEQYLI